MKKAQALIIDDEADIRELLEITLNRMDIETETAENIHQAHTLLKESGEPLLLRKLILGIQAQVRGKSLTGLIIICDALIRPASTHKNPRGVFI